MDSGPLYFTFGMGLGSFPREYFWNGVGSGTKASYRFGADASGSWLELGKGDFNLTQKVQVRPDTEYNLQVAIRGNPSRSRLTVKLCPKLILFSDRWQPRCIEHNFKPEVSGTWTTHHASFNSGDLGRDGWLGWPITILLQNASRDETLQITDVRLVDGWNNVVANGDFAAGPDRWIMISDFEHLGWHVKNLYLQLFFEAGAVGLGVFAISLIVAFVAALRGARNRSIVEPAMAGAIAGFAVVGLIGSLLDNPRPATLFFFVLFWALLPATPTARDNPGRHRRPGDEIQSAAAISGIGDDGAGASPRPGTRGR